MAKGIPFDLMKMKPKKSDSGGKQNRGNSLAVERNFRIMDNPTRERVDSATRKVVNTSY
jgi:hypothetical protein